jgi:hypothetical protein
MKQRLFKRSDFLCFAVDSIRSEGNLQLYQYLKPESGQDHPFPDLELEVWDSWKQYPNIPQIKDLTQGKGLELLAWLLHTFGLRLYFSRLKESDKKLVVKKEKEDNILDHLTLDDFAFLFVQVENNINKWNLMYSAWKSEYIEGWKENESVQHCECDRNSLSEGDAAKIKTINRCGYEYPSGAGVAGKDGKHRYNEMTKYLYNAYYAENEASKTNREALDSAIKELVEKERAKNNDDDENMDDHSPVNNFQELSSSDEELDAIRASEWSMNLLDSADNFFEA